MAIRTKNTDNFRKLAETLDGMEVAHDFGHLPYAGVGDRYRPSLYRQRGST
jgi:hypothetical protein